jgi:hypothetical protein
MIKFGTGQILTEDSQPVQKTASAQPLTLEDVQEIEREGETDSEG